MDYPKYYEPKNSLNLFGLDKYFKLLSSLHSKEKLPKVLMLTSPSGTGKSTLINHFLFSIFDKKNYDQLHHKLLELSSLYNQFINDIFPNIIYIKGSNFKSIKIEDIRNLKLNILQSSIINKNRFIILDDVETFNINSLNALLKIIEEPSKNNFFVLINNKTKPLLDTVKSRALEFKIILKETDRIKIINKLVKFHGIKTVLDPEKSKLTPGNFIKFNYICEKYDIFPNNDFSKNLSTLLNIYKKNKESIIIYLVFYLADFYFMNLRDKNIIKNDKIYEIKSHVFDNLNKYLTLNLNQNSLINAINNKINYD